MTKSAAPVNPRQPIAVWLAQVSKLREALPALEPLLDRVEKERMGRFRFPEDRARYVIGRGLLRKGLARYAPHLPKVIELTYSELGRPMLPRDAALEFSISHTRDLVAIAFAAQARVGIDLEFIQPTIDLAELAERILSEEDFAKFNAFPQREKQMAFYHAWTRKEAYLKALGEGISTGLKEVSVSFGSEALSTLSDRRDPTGSGAWRLQVLPTGAGYASCLAYDDPQREVALSTVLIENGEVVLTPVPLE